MPSDFTSGLERPYLQGSASSLPPGYMTRQQAAERLALPLTSFRRKVEGKRLAALLHHGQHIFLTEEVEALVVSGEFRLARPHVVQTQVDPERLDRVAEKGLHPGRPLSRDPSAVPLHAPAAPIDASTYARVYRHLGRGHGPAACVRDLSLEPSIVDFIYRSWSQQRKVQAVSVESVRLLKKICRKYVKDQDATTEQSLEAILSQLDMFEEKLLRLRLYIHLLGGELDQSVLVPESLTGQLQHYGIQLRHGRTVMNETEADAEEYDERVARIYVDQRKPGEGLEFLSRYRSLRFVTSVSYISLVPSAGSKRCDPLLGQAALYSYDGNHD